MRYLLLCLTLLLAACSSETLVRYQLKAPEKAPLLKATGYAPIDAQPGPSYEEKLMQAMDASRLDAYRRLAEQLYGQQLRGQARLSGDSLGRKTLDARVQGVVRGATLVANYIEGKFYTTKLQLDTAVLADLGSVESQPVETEQKWWY